MIEATLPAEQWDTDDALDVFGTLALRTLERSGTIVVERITTLAQFDAVQDDFMRIYRQDPYRTTFVSWQWLRAYFSSMAGQWRVLAARSLLNGRYVAFLPLEFRKASVGPIVLDGELYFGINPTADYTGLVMEPDSWEALEAFAIEIDGMKWDNFHLHNVADPRVRGIVDRLRRRNQVIPQLRNACRFVPLPASWETYVRERLSYRRRGKLRAAVRTIGRIPGFRFEEATAATLDIFIDALLQLNHERWRTNLSKARSTYGELFRKAFEQGSCRIFVIWKNDEALAAQAAFVDSVHRSWDVYMLGYNANYAKFSPGGCLIALTMERAIEEGYTTFDFLRGEEEYKNRFAAEIRLLENWVVRRYGFRNALVKMGRFLYYRSKALARKALLGKPLSTSGYMI